MADAPPEGSSREQAGNTRPAAPRRRYNDEYTGRFLDRVAFPLGGIGAGMICLEGTGALSHVSLRNRPEVFNEPCVFAAVCREGRDERRARARGAGAGVEALRPGRHRATAPPARRYGLPRFREAAFRVALPVRHASRSRDPDVPLAVEITGWSPFEPGDADSSSLPVAGSRVPVHQHARRRRVEAVFSFNAQELHGRSGKHAQRRAADARGGFVLWQAARREDKPSEDGAFSAAVDRRRA